jgi:hypothetical protein
VVPLLGRDATRARIRDTVLDVAAISQPQDTVMLVVCGRAALLDQHLYVAPQDLRLSQAGWESDFRAQGFDGDELAALLGSARALNRILVFDTSNPLPVRTGEKSSSFGLRAAVERWSRNQGVYAIAACVTPLAKPAGETSRGLLAGLLLESAGGTAALSASGHLTASDAIGVTEWFGAASERARPLLERLGLDSQLVQQSTKPKGFPLLVVAK